jgi:RNA polymerase sigma-70 factor, ECF subfamily
MTGRPLDATAVGRLYAVHGRVLLAYAASLAEDVPLAEDLLHQVFLSLLTGNVTVPEPALPYLLRAVRNTALNLQRTRRREVALSGDERWLEAPPGRNTEAVAIERALRRLPGQQREVVVLRVWAGMTYEEIGRITGCPANTAASRFRYAREHLRTMLAPLGI